MFHARLQRMLRRTPIPSRLLTHSPPALLAPHRTPMSHSASSMQPPTTATTADDAPAAFTLVSTLDPSHLPHWPNPTAAPSACPHHILILDSSHNPPTSAHAHLVSTALSAASTQYTAVVLLLATTNADKGKLPAAAITHRTQLMHKLALHLSPRVPTAIATIDCALFADKARALQSHLGGGARLDWLAGDDTLARILHPKYYPPPATVRGVIVDGFLVPTRSRVVVAPRPDVPVPEGADQGLAGELEANGMVVRMARVDAAQVQGVSSSLVREMRQRGDKGWRTWVVREVAEYIDEVQLYVNDDQSYK